MQDFSRFIVIPFNHSNGKTFNNKKYHTHCDQCGREIGFRAKRNDEYLCGSCVAKKRIKQYGNPMQGRAQDPTKFRQTHGNVNYSDYKTYMDSEGKNKRKYRMTCSGCEADRGYLVHHEATRTCLRCHTTKYTKKTKEQRRLYNCVKANINARFKNRNLLKQKGVFRHLPYTIHDLMQHLESKFEPWMNWGNHGLYSVHRKTWQIDHIRADSDFTYVSTSDGPFKQSWALSNLQPLESLANIKKSNH